MAFPTVQATTTGAADGGTNTSHTVNLPASISAGDRLLILLSSQGAPGTVSATGWTFLTTDDSGSTTLTLGWKDASGSEGSTVTVTTSGSVRCSMVSYRITGHQSGTAPEKGTAATGSSASPNPPSLTPSWGALDTLWIAACSVRSSSPVTAAPTNYSNLLANTSNDALGSAQRQLNAVSDDPSAFTCTSQQWVAQTFAIKPATTTAYTLTAALGTFALTGVAALKQITRLSSVGTYVLTGIAALQKIVKVTAVGSYTLTGQAAFQMISRVSAVGTYVLTGIAATLSSTAHQTLVLAAVAGSYLVSGIASVRGISRISAVGTYTYTGFAATLSKVISIVAATGSYIYSGITTTALNSVRRIIAVRGVYTYTGVAATLTKISSNARFLVAATGSYAVTGANVILAFYPRIRQGLSRRIDQAKLYKTRGTEAVLRQTRAVAAALRRTRSSDDGLH